MYLYVLLLLGALHTSAEETTNSSALPIICDGTCSNGRGVCYEGVYCICYNGFYGTACEATFDDLYPTTWLGLRAFIGTGYFALWGFSLMILYLIWQKGEFHLRSNRIALGVMATYSVYELGSALLFYIDPMGGTIYPVWLNTLWSCYAIIMGFVFLGLILSYWIELAHITTKIMKRELKLMKINSNYNPQLSLDSMKQQLNSMNKYKLPYILALLVISVFQIPYFVTAVKSMLIYSTLSMVNLILNILLYCVYCVGFVVYERKLFQLISNNASELKNEFKIVSARVRFFCIVSIGSIVLYTIYGVLLTAPLPTMILKVFQPVQQWVVTVGIFNIYLVYDHKCHRLCLRSYYGQSKTSSGGTWEESRESRGATLGGHLRDMESGDVELHQASSLYESNTDAEPLQGSSPSAVEATLP